MSLSSGEFEMSGAPPGSDAFLRHWTVLLFHFHHPGSELSAECYIHLHESNYLELIDFHTCAF